MNEYTPKGFKSWSDYRKWQHKCDVIMGIVLASASVILLVTCGGT